MNGVQRALVTGGAGFIGSHLVDELLDRGAEVVVYDNFSSGRHSFLPEGEIDLVEADLQDAEAVQAATEGCDLVVHCAADPDVRVGHQHAQRHFDENVATTQNVVEACRTTDAVDELWFMSTSTVYGEVDVFPTPEDFGPMKPISTYGASKLAGEAIVSGHAHTFDFDAIVYRFANILGPRLTHGVVYDFVHKLQDDPTTLEILGDGSQEKSYCHIDDMVDAVFVLHEWSNRDRVEVVNVGTESWTSVTEIADLVCEAMGLEDVDYEYTGGVDGGGGWKGDVKKMRLDIPTLTRLGWEPELSSDEAVKTTAEWMVDEVL
jgi:UDP-glucose 4-epimerase